MSRDFWARSVRWAAVLSIATLACSGQPRGQTAPQGQMPDGAGGPQATGAADGGASGGSTDGGGAGGGPDASPAPDGDAPQAVECPSSPALAPAGGGWKWEMPRPQGQTLNAGWAVSPSDVWMVGEAGAIEHWDGTSWTASLSPTMKGLKSVWASGPN